MRLFIVVCGRHAFVNAVFVVVNCRLPFDIAFTVVNGCP
jgi:hypothetical protein